MAGHELGPYLQAKRAGHTCLRPTLAKRAGHASAGQDEAPIPSIDSALQSVEAAAEGPLGQPKNETKAASQSVMASQLVDPTTKHIGILGGGQLGRMMALAAVWVMMLTVCTATACPGLCTM